MARLRNCQGPSWIRARRQGKTNAEGLYSFSFVSPGFYDVSVLAPGFRVAQSHVKLEVGLSARLDFPLELAAATGEVVTVTAGTGLVQSDSAAISTVIMQLNRTELNRSTCRTPPRN